jgi:hypothetical protein
MIGGKKEADLGTKFGAGCGIVQEVADGGNEVGAVEVLDDRKNFHVGIFGLKKRHDFVVDGTNALPTDHIEHGVGIGIYSLKMAVRAKHLQPCWKKQVDLASIFAQR